VTTAVWERARTASAARAVGLIDRELFAAHALDAMLAPADAACERVAPGLIIREPCEYATALVAHRRGIAQAQIAISQSAIEDGVLSMVDGGLEARTAGVTGAIRAAPFLTSFPASLDPSPWPDTRRFGRPASAPEPLPDWWPGDDRPLVYVTFGSVLGQLPEAATVYRTALAAVAGLPARVLLTVGRGLDPGRLGPIPANVRVERWVAQDDVLAAARLVVCHGGSGTVFGALGAGVPLVVCPLFADQGANAELVRSAGAGLRFVSADAVDRGVGQLDAPDAPLLRTTIATALADPRLAAAARGISAELTAAPSLPDRLRELLTAG
jgi:UDP:flavonoid glycosyltransferase YjiC (YdhE family)